MLPPQCCLPTLSIQVGHLMGCQPGLEEEDLPEDEELFVTGFGFGYGRGVGLWMEHGGMYPHLSHMALEYLEIPGMFFCA